MKMERRIYHVPDNGILITNAKQTFGIIDRKFYLVDEKGNRNELPEFHWSKFEEEKKDWHWTFSNTKLSKDLVGIFWAYTNGFSFIISDYNSLAEQNRKRNRKKPRIIQQKCRNDIKTMPSNSLNYSDKHLPRIQNAVRVETFLIAFITSSVGASIAKSRYWALT